MIRKILKVAAVVVGGFLFTLLTTSFTVVGIRKLLPTPEEAEPVVPVEEPATASVPERNASAYGNIMPLCVVAVAPLTKSTCPSTASAANCPAVCEPEKRSTRLLPHDATQNLPVCESVTRAVGLDSSVSVVPETRDVSEVWNCGVSTIA